MSLFNLNRIISLEKKEKYKSAAVDSIMSTLNDNVTCVFTYEERTQIMNRVCIRMLEKSKEKRTELLKELRELQNSIADLRI